MYLSIICSHFFWLIGSLSSMFSFLHFFLFLLFWTLGVCEYVCVTVCSLWWLLIVCMLAYPLPAKRLYLSYFDTCMCLVWLLRFVDSELLIVHGILFLVVNACYMFERKLWCWELLVMFYVCNLFYFFGYMVASLILLVHWKMETRKLMLFYDWDSIVELKIRIGIKNLYFIAWFPVCCWYEKPLLFSIMHIINSLIDSELATKSCILILCFAVFSSLK